MIFFVHPHMRVAEGSGWSWAEHPWFMSDSWDDPWPWSNNKSWPYAHGR